MRRTAMAMAMTATSVLGFVPGSPVSAQGNKLTQVWDNMTNPKVSIVIEHPPSLPLRVKRVAFGETKGGACADSLQSRMLEAFFANGVEVLDRSRLESIIAEQRLQGSVAFDQKDSTEVGGLKGANALIFVETHACDTSHTVSQQTCVNYTTKQSFPCNKYHTNATVRGQIQTIDLATSRVLAVRRIEGKASASADGGYPESDPLLQEAEQIAADKIRRMFFPWSEPRELVFFNDKDCNLKTAHAMLRAQDLAAALEMSEQNLETCRSLGDVKPRTLAHAYYNLGMVHFLQDNFEVAVRHLTEAAKLNSSETITSALTECRRAKQTADDMARYEAEQAAFVASGAGVETAPVIPQPAASSFAAKAPAAPSAAPAKSGSQASPEERLRKLEDLFKKGLVTKSEYERKRAEILAEL